jgi:hypothetical protein
MSIESLLGNLTVPIGTPASALGRAVVAAATDVLSVTTKLVPESPDQLPLVVALGFPVRVATEDTDTGT